MDEGMRIGLEKELVASLKVELKNAPNFDEDILTEKVRNVIREIMMKRNYAATSYSDQKIYKDLCNYYSVMRDLALYDYTHIGADFESSHSEPGISQTWINRDEILKGVHAFVGFF